MSFKSHSKSNNKKSAESQLTATPYPSLHIIPYAPISNHPLITRKAGSSGCFTPLSPLVTTRQPLNVSRAFPLTLPCGSPWMCHLAVPDITTCCCVSGRSRPTAKEVVEGTPGAVVVHKVCQRCTLTFQGPKQVINPRLVGWDLYIHIPPLLTLN